MKKHLQCGLTAALTLALLLTACGQKEADANDTPPDAQAGSLYEDFFTGDVTVTTNLINAGVEATTASFRAPDVYAAKGVDGANPSADASCPFEFYGVDSCQDLAIDAHGHALRIPNLHFQELDVLDALMKLNPAETPDVLFDAPLADISVCFGFMHHVPSCEYRVRVLDALVRQTRPGGIIAISFWEFMNEPATTSLAGKTTATPTAIAITLTISRSPTWCAASVRSTRAARSPCASLSASMPTVAAAISTAM